MPDFVSSAVGVERLNVLLNGQAVDVEEQGWECLALAATEMPERSKGRRRDRRISNLLAL